MMKRWTEQEDNKLRILYSNHSTTECARLMKKSYGSVKSRVRALELFKTKEQIRVIAAKRNTGQFKKGNNPHNTDFNGCISLRVDKTKHAYYYIRTNLSEWQLLHVYMYTIAHGSVPDNHIVVFKDGNSLNCTIENLEAITLQENMARNTIHRYPAELKQTIKAISRLKNKIKQYEKQD